MKNILLTYSRYSNRVQRVPGEFQTIEEAMEYTDKSYDRSCWFGWYVKWDDGKYGLKEIYAGRFAKGDNPFPALTFLNYADGKLYFPVDWRG